MEQVQGFERFLAGFIGRHPEWFGDSEAVKARERFEEAMARVPSVEPAVEDLLEAAVAKEAEYGDVGDSLVGVGDGDGEAVAEEYRDEEAEAEEQAALLSDGEF